MILVDDKFKFLTADNKLTPQGEAILNESGLREFTILNNDGDKPTNFSGIKVENDGADDGKAIIYMSGVVMEKSWFADFFFENYINATDLGDAVRTCDEAKEITFKIHSPGGTVLEGHKVYNQIKKIKAKTICEIDSLAGSIASVIYCAGDVKCMYKNTSTLFMHEAMGTAFYARADEMKTLSDWIEDVNNSIADIYVDACNNGTTAEKFREKMAMNPGYNMTAKNAKKLGLVDMVLDKPKKSKNPPTPDDKNKDGADAENNTSNAHANVVVARALARIKN